MNREQSAAALVRALAMIGTPREVCPTCNAVAGSRAYGGEAHTPRSAALMLGLDPQAVYRAVRKRRGT